MFRVLSVNGMDVYFDQHQNGRWKITARKDGESFELSRSLSPEALPSVVNVLLQQRDTQGDEDFTQLSRKIKTLIKQQYVIYKESRNR